MKLIKEQEIFYVACSTNDFGFKFDDTYEFLSMEEVEKFLGMKNDYSSLQLFKKIKYKLNLL
jgi:hypothetical protein